MWAIRARGLTKKFDQKTVVDGLDLEIEEGEIFGLVGPDGAGKTTTMRLLTGILMPTAGDAWVEEQHIVKDAEALKENIAYMSQRFGLYGDLSVMENIHFYADIYTVPKSKRTAKIEQLLDFTKLGPFKDRLARNLSGGMKQKLGLACALVHTPRVLFLDEPTNGGKGRAKPASQGRVKTGHFEGRCCISVLKRRTMIYGKRTQDGYRQYDHRIARERLEASADRPGTWRQPGNRWPLCPAPA